MEIIEQDQDGVTVLSFSGSLDTLTSPEAMETLETCAAEGKNQIVADLSGVDFISSAGLRVILSAMKQTRKEGGDFRLAALPEGVHKVIAMAGFTSILKLFPDVGGAVESFRE
jgi:anti-anti-sigma factor